MKLEDVGNGETSKRRTNPRTQLKAGPPSNTLTNLVPQVRDEMLVEEGHAGKNRLRANEEKSCHSCFRRKEVNQINYNY